MSDTIQLREPTVTEAEVRAAVKGTKIDNPKIITEITKLVNRWATEGKRPLHTWCRVYGTKCAMTAKEYFAKRHQEYGTVLKLLTSYVGRGAKSSVVKTPSAPIATTHTTTKPAKTEAPRAGKPRKSISQSSEIVSEDGNGKVTCRRHTLDGPTGILCQWDEFPQDGNKENRYLVGDSTLRMELMS